LDGVQYVPDNCESSVASTKRREHTAWYVVIIIIIIIIIRCPWNVTPALALSPSWDGWMYSVTQPFVTFLRILAYNILL
jgi:hypothetical protein